MKLDLASGPKPAPGFLGTDIAMVTNYQFDLLRTWPFEWNCADELRCSHFIEHIPAANLGTKDLFFLFFDEAYRILKPGGVFTVIWPALHCTAAFQDPTHRRFIPPEALQYLSKPWREANNLSHYNVNCNWFLQHLTLTEAAKDRTKWFHGVAEYTATLIKE